MQQADFSQSLIKPRDAKESLSTATSQAETPKNGGYLGSANGVDRSPSPAVTAQPATQESSSPKTDATGPLDGRSGMEATPATVNYTPKYSPAYTPGAVGSAAVVDRNGLALAPPPRMSPPSGSRTPVNDFGMYVGGENGARDIVEAVSNGIHPAGHMRTTSGGTTPGRRNAANTPRSASNAAVGTASPSRGERTPGGTSSTPLSPAARRNHNSSLRSVGTGKNSSSSRIDPDQVPRPVGQPDPIKEEGGKVYETNKYHVPPPATAVCTVVDRGSCSCEFIRSTVNQVPAYPSTANTAHVPIALMIQPFAELTPLEAPVPAVDFGEQGPLRCTRCKAYVNPFFQWTNFGREVVCNFCSQRFEVPNDYLCALDDKGQRRDLADRPELQRGTVDYVAPRDYSDERLPGVPAVALVVDASKRSVQSGLLDQVLWTLRALVNFPQDSPQRIALILFDQALHFYAFHPGWEDARGITVADIEDPFVPMGHGAFCVDVMTDAIFKGQMEALLEKLPGQFANTHLEQAAGGAALKAATDLLAQQGGGHVVMFHATLPNTGLGALRARDDIKLYSTPEAALQGGGLFTPQQAPFFETLSDHCLSTGVAVSVFCCPFINTYIDVATLSMVPRRTGGEVHHLPGFTVRRDGEQLHHKIARTIVQGAVYSCVFKLRLSKGLTVENMHATWDAEVIDQSTFQLSRLSPDSTAVFVLSHAERIENSKHTYFQAACLHTDRHGRRLIRVHTMQLPITTSLSNVFRYTEIDAVTTVLLKQAATWALSGNGAFKEKLTKATVDMLHAYRTNCASMTSSGQLILPESLKLLPLYIGAIRKMAAFRSGSDIRVDDRMAGLIRMLALPVALTSALVYPKIYPLQPLPEKAGYPTEVGENVHMPPSIPCSVDRLAADRIYLVDNGSQLHLYVRDEVPAEVLHDAFGVTSAAEVEDAIRAMSSPEAALSEEGGRVMAIIQQVRRDRYRLPWQPLRVATVGTPDEARMIALMSEDRVAGEMPYVDFLCHVHKSVQNKLD
eukprot:TRINITY_DN27156_c0_g1_i1.p1 TRINITY_DN27156_c0_g1~~TRINITY_DN27156_c0_g1_i1.p1  ORF type:complete len:1017 (-),score=187.41 TRINITY_DN27156_c0_g1_i1:458-3508(-)